MNSSREDYLRTIYGLYENLEKKPFGIKSVNIAKDLDITRASVSAIIKKLSNDGILILKKY